MLFKRLGQDRVISRLRCLEEVVLQSLSHTLAVIYELVLTSIEDRDTRLFDLNVVDQQGLIFLVLSHLALQVLLLDPYALFL